MDQIFVKDFKSGKFYQLYELDIQRLSQNCFQTFNEDAKEKISKRNIKGLVRKCYMPVKKGRYNPSADEIDTYIKMVSAQDNPTELSQEDFYKSVQQYFEVNAKRDSAFLMQDNIILFDFENHENQEQQKKRIFEIGYSRYGKNFIDTAYDLAMKPLESSGFKHQSEYSFGEFFNIYKEMNKLPQKMDGKNAEPLLEEDYERLFKKISSNGTTITKIDYELFFLKSIIG